MMWVDVFFFKQKTAYEMRISDWSSDVCSSDLYPAHQGDGKRQLVSDAVLRVAKQEGPRRSGDIDREDQQHGLRHGETHGFGGVDEIGRASCRARVCTSV